MPDDVLARFRALKEKAAKTAAGTGAVPVPVPAYFSVPGIVFRPASAGVPKPASVERLLASARSAAKNESHHVEMHYPANSDTEKKVEDILREAGRGLSKGAIFRKVVNGPYDGNNPEHKRMYGYLGNLLESWVIKNRVDVEDMPPVQGSNTPWKAYMLVEHDENRKMFTDSEGIKHDERIRDILADPPRSVLEEQKKTVADEMLGFLYDEEVKNRRGKQSVRREEIMERLGKTHDKFVVDSVFRECMNRGWIVESMRGCFYAVAPSMSIAEALNRNTSDYLAGKLPVAPGPVLQSHGDKIVLPGPGDLTEAIAEKTGFDRMTGARRAIENEQRRMITGSSHPFDFDERVEATKKQFDGLISDLSAKALVMANWKKEVEEDPAVKALREAPPDKIVHLFDDAGEPVRKHVIPVRSPDATDEKADATDDVLSNIFKEAKPAAPFVRSDSVHPKTPIETAPKPTEAEIRMSEELCVTCGKWPGIKPKVPWGRLECEHCRTETGTCKICGVNRNDCSC